VVEARPHGALFAPKEAASNISGCLARQREPIGRSLRVGLGGSGGEKAQLGELVWMECGRRTCGWTCVAYEWGWLCAASKALCIMDKLPPLGFRAVNSAVC